MTLKRTTAILLAAATLGAPVQADIAGPYLAARQASILSDYAEGVKYYARAVRADPQNLALLENAVLTHLGAGDLDAAVRFGNTYISAGGTNPVVALVQKVAALKAGDFGPATQPGTAQNGLAPLLDGLLQGWAQLGDGKMSDAEAAFERVAQDADFAPLAYYHEALARTQVGDFEAAADILSGNRYGALTLSPRGIESHAQVLMQLDREADALELLDATAAIGFSPELNDLKARIEAGEGRNFTFVTTPQEGAAEVLFTIAAILQGRAAPELVLVYTRLASYLRPDHAQSILMTGELLEDLNQFKLAEAAFHTVAQDHPAFFMAELGRAQALFADDRKDTAVEVLDALSRSHPDIPAIHATHGDFLGRTERDAEAVTAYTKSIDLREDGDRAAWPVYYARGIVKERSGDFPGMEADFRKALELQPNQPDVLNYLGYSLVEQKIKLDEALGMIETAVAERPDSGYITDSLGWIFYRLGRYEEAVAPMERAVMLLPVDPIVNDHLGDVYWKVGRTREAEFQWKRALSFDPVEKEADRIRRKLDVGLDTVLEEEAAANPE